MKVSVNLDLCQGHAQCEDSASEVFHINDRALCEVLLEDVPKHLKPKVLEAMRRCPTEAITVKG